MAQDSMREDISGAFYDALEFITDAIESKGVVFVHCQQGVSRSAAIVLAYLMWASRISYEAALDIVRAERPTVNPNIGFACALLAWGEMLSSASYALHAWSCERAQLPQSAEVQVADRDGDVWIMRPVPITKGLPPRDALAEAVAAAGGPHPEKRMGPDAFLLFKRGARAACWTAAQPSAGTAASAHKHWRRLQMFHGLPHDVPVTLITRDAEVADFWAILRDSSPVLSAAPSPEIGDADVEEEMSIGVESSGRSGRNSLVRNDPDTLRIQMQMVTLQHLLAEVSVVLQAAARMLEQRLEDPTNEDAVMPPGHQQAVDSYERLQNSQTLLVTQPEVLSECLSVRSAMLELLFSLMPALGMDPLWNLRAALEHFGSQLDHLDGEALLRTEEVLMGQLRHATNALEFSGEDEDGIDLDDDA